MDAIIYTAKGWEASKPISQMTAEERKLARQMVARDFAITHGIGEKKTATA